jgi:hypothetical protein
MRIAIMDARRRIAALAVSALIAAAPAQAAGFRFQAPDAEHAHRPFTPPADGRLTADQVKTFIAVRRRALATVAAPGESAADPAATLARALAGLTSEATAAADLGVDLDEYRWVSARVAEVEPAGGGGDVLASITAAISRAGESSNSSETGQRERAAADELQKARVAYNRQLLSRYRAELDALAKTPRPTPRP